MSAHKLFEQWSSPDALDALTLLLAFATALFLAIWWRGRNFWLVVVLTVIVWIALYSAVIVLPYPAVNYPEKYRLLVITFILVILVCYRVAMPRVAPSISWLRNWRTRVGVIFLGIAISISVAYYVASRPAWNDDPFNGITTTELLSPRVLLYPHDALQFEYSFPRGLQVGEAGLVVVSVLERIGAGGKGLLFPPGWVHADLVAPDYDVTPVETTEHSTGFLIWRAPNNRPDDEGVEVQPVWYWVVRPKSTGSHEMFVRLFYCMKELDLKGLYSDANRFDLWERSEYVEHSEYGLSDIVTYDQYVRNGLEDKWPVLIATQGMRAYVPSPILSQLTPWLAFLSGVAGFAGIFFGSRSKELPPTTGSG